MAPKLRTSVDTAGTRVAAIFGSLIILTVIVSWRVTRYLRRRGGAPGFVKRLITGREDRRMRLAQQ